MIQRRAHQRCFALALAAVAASAAQATPARTLLPGAPWAQELADRALPGGGRVLIVRDPEATRVTARIGFPADDAEDTLVHLAAALQDGCDQALGRALGEADATLVIEQDGESLVAVLEAPHEAHAELLGQTLRALAAPPRASTGLAPTGQLMTRLQRVDLAGHSTWLGPAPGGSAADAAVAAALLALEAPERVDGARAGTEVAELAARTVRREALVLGLVGDVDVEGALALAAESVALLPERARGLAPATTPLVVPLTSEVWVAAADERSVGAIVFLGRGCRADAPDTGALLVLEELLAEALTTELAPALAQAGAGGGSAERSLGFRATPGFRRGGRLVAWFGGPVGEVASAGAQLRAFLARDLAPSLAADATSLERARSRALARLDLAEAPVERLRREHRLALRGVGAGTRARLVADVSGLTASALADAAQRYLATDGFLCVASTSSALVPDLAALGALVVLPGPAAAGEPSTGEAEAAPTVEGERAAAEIALEQLLDSVGGRAGWASAGVAELTLRVTRAGVTVRARTTLELEGTRLVLRVEEGGETVLDDSGAVWRCLGEERRLDTAALARDARLGLLGLLHRLARGGSTTMRRVTEGLVVEVDGSEVCLVELDGDGRPARLFTRDVPERAWRFEGWQTVGGLQVPRRIVDEPRGVATEVETCRFLERYAPAEPPR